MGVQVLESLIRRPGRQFEGVQEVELRGDLIRVAQALARTSRLGFVMLEMPGPMGVPDAFVMRADPEALRARVEAGIEPILDQYACKLLTALRKERGDLGAAGARLGWAEYTSNRALSRLRQASAVVVTKRGRVHPNPALRPVGKSIAVEAKVKDWRRALGQARTYASWTDSYQLLMGQVPDAVADDLTSMVASDGGGLAIGSRWVVRPHLRPGVGSLVASEYFLAAFLATSPPPS